MARLCFLFHPNAWQLIKSFPIKIDCFSIFLAFYSLTSCGAPAVEFCCFIATHISFTLPWLLWKLLLPRFVPYDEKGKFIERGRRRKSIFLNKKMESFQDSCRFPSRRKFKTFLLTLFRAWWWNQSAFSHSVGGCQEVEGWNEGNRENSYEKSILIGW